MHEEAPTTWAAQPSEPSLLTCSGLLSAAHAAAQHWSRPCLCNCLQLCWHRSSRFVVLWLTHLPACLGPHWTQACSLALAAVLSGDAPMPAALDTLSALDEALQPLAAEAGAEMLLPEKRPSAAAVVAFASCALTFAQIARKLYYAAALALLDPAAAEAAETQLARAETGVSRLAAAHAAALMAATVGAGAGS